MAVRPCDGKSIRCAAAPISLLLVRGACSTFTASGECGLDAVQTLVLDEADHMFDMGFLPDLRRIIAALPAQRQNLLFSATMPAQIRGLANKMLHDPVVAELATASPAQTIEHALYPVREGRKLDLLDHLLRNDVAESAIVFVRTKYRAKRLAKKLCGLGHATVALQGNMSQRQRDAAMSGFRTGEHRVLVATDIVARGIDVAQVAHVINFDVPNVPDAYVHRIGRTGRANRQGRGHTFVTRDDRAAIRAIERRIGKSIPCIELSAYPEVTYPEVTYPEATRALSQPPVHQGARSSDGVRGRATNDRSSGGRSANGRSSDGRSSGGHKSARGSAGRRSRPSSDTASSGSRGPGQRGPAASSGESQGSGAGDKTSAEAVQALKRQRRRRRRRPWEGMHADA